MSKNMRDAPSTADAIATGLNRHLLLGGLVAAGLVFGLGGMASAIQFSGAVVTTGRLVVSSNVKKVQHPTGGTVSAIGVKDGDRVKAGDLLVQFDTTVAAASLGIVSRGLDEAVARKARLDAEFAGLSSVEFPDDLLGRVDETGVSAAIAIERGAFASRRAARDGERAQLANKIDELRQQSVGIEAQSAAVRRQIALTGQDLEGLRVLRAKQLISTERLSNEERRAAQLDGQLGQIVASTGQVGVEMAQAEIQILQIDKDFRAEVSRDLAETSSKISELTERRVAAEDQLRKLSVRSPIDGIAFQRAVHTVGGVVGAGEIMMMIVPDTDVLMVEAQISPNEVDRVHPNQSANIRFTSLGQKTTPEYEGRVETVSPDLVVDQRTGQGFFTARIALPIGAMAEVTGRLVPGMPVEAFIATGERTVLSYLAKPLGDQIVRAFRER